MCSAGTLPPPVHGSSQAAQPCMPCDIETATSSQVDQEECYLCTEVGTPEAPLVQVCSCSSWLHLRCQRKIIDMMPAYEMHCSICKTKYNNVTVQASAVRLTVFAYLVMAAALTKSCLISGAVYLFVVYANDTSNIHNIGALIGGILLLTAIYFLPIAFFPVVLIRRHSWPQIGSIDGYMYLLRRRYNVRVNPQPITQVTTVGSSPSRSRLIAYLEKNLIYDPMRPRREEGEAQARGVPRAQPQEDGEGRSS